MVPARVESAEADDKSWYRPSTDRSPRMQSEITSYGFHYAAIRTPIKNSATHNYLRITEFVAPYYSLILPNSSYNMASVIVPIDDETTAFHFIAWGGKTRPSTEEWRKFARAQKGIDLNERWEPVRGIENNFLQDRNAMKLGKFTGIKGIPNQDIAMWVTIGKIADRTKDILGASDLAIVEFRRLMVDEARKVAEGGNAIGTEEPRLPQSKIRSAQGIYPKTTDWRNLDDAAVAAAE